MAEDQRDLNREPQRVSVRVAGCGSVARFIGLKIWGIDIVKGGTLFFLCGCLVLANGCASYHVVEQKAKSHVEWEEANKRNVEVAGRPAYYALLPLTIPFDVVTSPVQLVILLSWPVAKAPP